MKNKNISLLDALKNTGATVAPEQETFLKALETALETRLKDSDENYAEAMKAALDEVLGAIPKDEAGKTVTFAEQLKSIAESVEKMEKQSIRKLSDVEKFQLRKTVKDNHAAIVDAIKNKKELEFTFSAKAAAMFTNTSAMTNGTGVLLPLVENFDVESDIARIRYPENFILNVIPNRQVAKVPQQIIRTEQATAEGAVALVAEGGTKPLVSDTFVRNMTERKKYAGHIEWTEEFEMDNEMLFAEILRLFEEKTVRAWQAGLLATMITNAVAYTTSAMDDTLVIPDNGLAVIAAQSVIQGMNFNPDIVLMNPVDIVTTMFTQDAEGNSRLLPYMQNGKINGLTVIASNTITAGTALIGDSSVYRELHSDFILRFGTYDDQFIKNEKSAVGEVFSILRIANNEKAAWMKLTLATVKAALLKP